MPRYNPFRPNSVVGPGMFSGRLNEIETIEQCLFQTKHSNPQHYMIDGERGIGKSSLLLYSKLFAEGHLIGQRFNFIVLSIELSSTTTFSDLISKLSDSFRSAMIVKNDVATISGTAWEFVSNWSIFGIEYKKTHSTPSNITIISDFALAITNFINAYSNDVDGVLILIDEADKPDPIVCNLGEFSKLLTERLSNLSCEKVCIGVAGLPNIHQKFKQGHESSLRVFETLTLKPLLEEESKNVIRLGLEDANGKNSDQTDIEDTALSYIVHLAEGYPHFIQQFGFSAFQADADGLIDRMDVYKGAFDENGAMDQLGRKFFYEMYYEKIWSPDYRRVLNAMADNLDGWISRKDIKLASGVRDSQVTNALNALKSRNIILSNEDRLGFYRLPTKSFAVWIKAVNEKVQSDELKD